MLFNERLNRLNKYDELKDEQTKSKRNWWKRLNAIQRSDTSHDEFGSETGKKIALNNNSTAAENWRWKKIPVARTNIHPI